MARKKSAGCIWLRRCRIGRSPRICGARRDQVILPDGSFCRGAVPRFLLFRRPKSPAYSPPSRPTEGRVAIVTAAGRDAVDADAPITNGVEADGEDVWS